MYVDPQRPFDLRCASVTVLNISALPARTIGKVCDRVNVAFNLEVS